MAQSNNIPIWTNVNKTMNVAIKAYLADNQLTVSEFVRNCIAAKLLDSGYLQQEQLEMMLYER